MADEIKKTVDDYVYFLNEAMAIHAKKAVENLSFNKTELVEIVDITNRDKGQYLVWNGSTKYFVYSTNHNYKIGTKVYVTIRNNDYKEQKEISGIYYDESSNQDNFYDYELPLSTYQQKLVVFTSDSSFGLVTNYDQANEKIGEEYLLLTGERNIPQTPYKYLAVSVLINPTSQALIIWLRTSPQEPFAMYRK